VDSVDGARLQPFFFLMDEAVTFTAPSQLPAQRLQTAATHHHLFLFRVRYLVNERDARYQEGGRRTATDK
jgi:hypothetical protein